MKKLIIVLIAIFSICGYSQCFECVKTVGGWIDETAVDIEKTTDGLVYLIDSNSFVSSTINKYDFNCNLVWSKTFGNFNIDVQGVTSDELGNIYVAIRSDIGGSIPYVINGFNLRRGLYIYKLNSAGIVLWGKNITSVVTYNLNDIHYFENQLYVTGTFYGDIIFSNSLTLSSPLFVSNPVAFIATYNTNGNFIHAIKFGSGNDIFKYSEIDNEGSIYLTRSNYNGLNSHIDKFTATLQLSWTKELSNSPNPNLFGILTPTGIEFNSENNKLYVWGAMRSTTNIMGTVFTVVANQNYYIQSVLVELDKMNGNTGNIKRFDNNSLHDDSSRSALEFRRSAYMAEKNGYLYVLTSFSKNMSFPSGIISTHSYSVGNYFSEDLLLFKIKLSDFTYELVFKSHGIPNLTYRVADLPGPLVFKNNDLYLTSSFSSKPMLLNGTTINNSSGNNSQDALLYKFNISSTANISNIVVNNTCLNELTQFSLNGSFDSIIWNFGDPSSTSNTSSSSNPQHQFSTSGNYHIVATVTCGTSTQIVERDIVINARPIINTLSPITHCETIAGSQICSEFDTSNLNSLLIGNQQNVLIQFIASNGNILPSPLPNPYTNSNLGGDFITVKASYVNNSNCFSSTVINFTALPKPSLPTLISPQIFCIRQTATLNSIIISGQNVKWYNAPANGNLLANALPLQNGVTYYASQTINNCESQRVAVTVTIQNTNAPTGTNQSFCSTQNATLNEIIITGTAIKWYANNSSNTVLIPTTSLLDGVTYYATQTINNCESVSKLPVTITLINTLNANNFVVEFCDDANDKSEIINLTNYNNNLISNTANCTFTYYNSFNGATNQTINDQITNSTNFILNQGIKIIFVRITSTNSCHQIVELKLFLQPKPILTIKDIEPICDNSNVTIYGDLGYDDYTWSTGEKTTSISISSPGDYFLTVIKNNALINCSTTKNFKVVRSTKATIETIETKDWTDLENIIIVNTSGFGDYEYSVDGLNYQTNNSFSNLSSGVYTAYVRDKNGCGIAKKDIFLLMYPKFFTPNGDGFNDTWAIRFSNIETNLKTVIFDRFGKLLKILNNGGSWDGKFNGNDLLSDDYWFVITRENGLEYKGHFSLKR